MTANQNLFPLNFSRANPKATSADDSTAPIVASTTSTSELRMKMPK
jgi:hypothetical protein